MHSLAITEQGVHLRIESEVLVVAKEGRVLRRVRLAEIEQLLLYGRIEVSSAAMASLVRREVDVVFLTLKGDFRARLVGPGRRQAMLRINQMRRALDPAFCLGVARNLVNAKILHQRQLLLRAQRRLRDPDLATYLGRLRLLADAALTAADLDSLRGTEGMAAAHYFANLNKLILVPDMVFQGRSRRPPRDAVNACLSFGYALWGRVLETQLLKAGLDPAVGFFHQPHDGRPSLMLDLLEEFRPLVDALVFRLINRRQIGPTDFERRAGPDDLEAPAETGVGQAEQPVVTGVYLAETGRRVFLTELFRRLRERIYYPPRQANFELRDICGEQVYHLARVIRGEDSAYAPFLPAG